MQDHLVSIVQELKGDLNRIGLMDEAATQQAVILRLLSALGWNHFDVSEVTPQYSIGVQKVDYALQLAHTPKVFIEVKRPSVSDLDSQEEQLLRYSFGRGVRLAVLTNGIEWRFYLPLLAGSWSQRRFCTIDLSVDKPPTISRRLASILAKENVVSEKAFSTAKTWYDRTQKKKAAEEAMPEAWNQIVLEPDDLLVNLLRKATRRICGVQPGLRLTKRFLAKHRDDLLLPETPSRPVRGATVRSSGATPGPKRQRKPIQGFVFLGVSYPVRTWKDLLTTLSGAVYQKHTRRFALVLSEPTLRGTKRSYFSRDARELHTPGQIGDSGYYVETHVSSERAEVICRRLLEVFGYSNQDLTIER